MRPITPAAQKSQENLRKNQRENLKTKRKEKTMAIQDLVACHTPAKLRIIL